jgi:hypothetical protein
MARCVDDRRGPAIKSRSSEALMAYFTTISSLQMPLPGRLPQDVLLRKRSGTFCRRRRRRQPHDLFV